MFFVLGFQFSSSAQFISLAKAEELVISNNLNLKNEQLKTEYRQKLIKSATAIPQTQIFLKPDRLVALILIRE